MANRELYVGLMSGTSLDGVDAVLLEFTGERHRIVDKVFLPFDDAIRNRLLALHDPGHGEIHHAATTGNDLARIYATAVASLLAKSRTKSASIQAIGCHGQTIRHRPDAGYTIQIGNGALLAELTGNIVVCDFRSRDIAAGGEGAPLVPAFHQAAFADARIHRVILNIGGIANVTDLRADAVLGFDTGPGNLLMDAWIKQHLGENFDSDGRWAQGGKVIPRLLANLLKPDYFIRKPPKSTGRDFFNLEWLQGALTGTEDARDVQATLLEFTVSSITRAIEYFCKGAEEIYVCGGGASNPALMQRLATAAPIPVKTTAALGIDPDWVEACAFAWLARQALHLRAGNLPSVTGARGPRVLGAIYPA
ncbi:MAG TPA: anhydro-N-acetylmuramic acid kinase [Burkholderiales bacterium]|nr:anhydro-N-acetylmuramic acid kinase [Burkholderiales bacterium]